MTARGNDQVKLVVTDLAGTTVDYGSCAPAGAFVDVTLASGLSVEGPILRAEWSDPNGDALPDLLLWTPDEVRALLSKDGVAGERVLRVPGA